MPKTKRYIIAVASALICFGLLFAIIVTVIRGNNGKSSFSQTVSSDKTAERPYCLLVLGKDKVSGLTDVIILVAFDTAKNRIYVMQIPRDTYAEYGSEYKKINGALKYFGSEDKVAELFGGAFGVHIDGYISLDLSAFRKAIDAIGGVELELEETLYYSDPEQSLYISLPAGRHTLDGRQSEMLVRYRSGYVRGDLDRLDMQKRFLAALFKKLQTSVDLSNAYALAESVLPNMNTNVDISVFVALGLKALRVDSASVGFLTLPGEDIVSKKTGASFYVVSRLPVQRVIEDLFACENVNVDIEEIFKHPSYADFREIYDKKFDYLVSYANDIG